MNQKKIVSLFLVLALIASPAVAQSDNGDQQGIQYSILQFGDTMGNGIGDVWDAITFWDNGEEPEKEVYILNNEGNRISIATEETLNDLVKGFQVENTNEFLENIEGNTTAQGETLDLVESNTGTIASNIESTTDGFGYTVNKQWTTIFDLESNKPLSLVRDRQLESGDGNVTVVNGAEYRVRTTGASTTTTLDSAEQLEYAPGKEVQWGLGVRTNDCDSTEGTIRFGAFDNEDGIYAGCDSQGKFLALKRGGDIEQKVYQEDWNLDTLDGSGDINNPSSGDLDYSDGVVVQGGFIYYGYGPLQVGFLVDKANDKPGKTFTIAHIFEPNDTISIEDTSLPVRAQTENPSGVTSNTTVYVGGRQASILGSRTTNDRITSDYKDSFTVESDWTHVASWRSKSDFEEIRTQIEGFTMIPNCNIQWDWRVHNTSIQGTYNTPTGTRLSETSLEVNNATFTINDLTDYGVKVDESLIRSGGKNDQGSSSSAINTLKPEYLTATLFIRATDTSCEVPSTVTRMREGW